MTNFHEHKLWQEAYVALMDLHEAFDTVEVEPRQHEIAKKLLDSAEMVAALIADGLTQRSRALSLELIARAVGEVAKTRTHLAIAWGRGLLDDAVFKKLDERYDRLSSSLQSFK